MSLGLRSKRIEIPFRLGNLADAVKTTQSLGGLTTVAPSIFPGPSRTFQDLPGVRTVPSHLEVSAPTPHGNWCEIWRKTSELLKALAISRSLTKGFEMF